MPLLEVRGLTKRFGGLPAVEDVDLDVEAGRVVAVIGPNGAGKSTLLRLLAGLLTPSAGRGIRLDGVDLTGRGPHRVRRAGIATVQQTPAAFASMSVGENVALGASFGSTGRGRVTPSTARHRAGEVLDLVGIGHAAAWPAARLTLHERRRLELARALAGRPRLLLLDEVMAGGGPADLDGLVDVLQRVRDHLGVGVVLVEHVMQAVSALADEVVVLDAGRRIAAGPPDQVLHDARVVDAYLGTPAVASDPTDDGGGVRAAH